jgi:maleate isomerase
MASNDNWGVEARVGMFIVGSECVPEAEWWAMVPPNVSVHAARVTARAPWARWRTDRGGVDLEDDLVRGARQFAAMRLSAIAVGHSSSSFAGGKGWDEAVVTELSRILATNSLTPRVYITTNGLDCLAALRAAGIERPYLILPPWFGNDILAAGLRYFADQGVTLSGHLRYDPGPDWRDVPPGDLYRLGMGFAQEIDPLGAQIVSSCPATADGVLIAGTGFRCVAILD